MSKTSSMGEDSLRTSSPPGDKRRNKLGYQRTSVACGHCRRRKIRCLLPTPEDPLGRCANCIRLKKECTFYPVDHTPDGSRRNTGNSITDPSSAPMTPSQMSDSQPHSSDFDVSTNADPYKLNFQGSRSLSMTMPFASSPSNITMHPSFTISSVSEHEEWPSSLVPSHPQQHPVPPGGQASPYWASEASTPNTSNFPTGVSNLQGAGSGSYESSPLSSYPHADQQNQPWPPTRSLSYSHLEGLHHQHHYGGSYPGLSSTMTDGLQQFTQPGTSSPAALTPGDSTHASSSYQIQNQASPYGNPWLSPTQTDQNASSSWFAEPTSIMPIHSHDQVGDQFEDSSLYPPHTHPSI